MSRRRTTGVTSAEMVEAIRTAANELDLAGMLNRRQWSAAVAAIDEGLARNGIRDITRTAGADASVLAGALRTATVEQNLVGLLDREQWADALRAIDASL